MNTSDFFDAIYHNAKANSIIIMNEEGIVLDVNTAFSTTFGYAPADIIHQNFRILFREADLKKNLPETELLNARTNGSANDDNYLVQKDESLVWVTGETIFTSKGEEKYYVKIIHNIHAQKQLENFLMESNEFIDSIFNTIKGAGLLILDYRLKLVKANKEFTRIFHLPKEPVEGTSLYDIHPFWEQDDIRNALKAILVQNKNISNEVYEYSNGESSESFRLHSKIVANYDGLGNRILIVITPGSSSR